MPPEDTFDIERLRAQQQRLTRKARLHWIHIAIVGLSALVTLTAWHTSRTTLDERHLWRFEQEATRIVELMRERLQHYEDALLSGVAAMQVQNGQMSRRDWRQYTASLDLKHRYPGISGIGIIHYVEPEALDAFVARVRLEKPDFRVHPTHDIDLHLPITYVEPEAENAAAVGLDVAFETNRRAAAVRARQTGTTQISGPITLVQDAGKTPGFLFYAPYYDTSHTAVPVPHRIGTREDTFQGFVYAPLVVRHLVAGVLGEASRNVWFEIRDGEDVLYADSKPRDAGESAFQTTRDIELYGRVWTFRIGSHAGFVHSATIDQPLMVLLLGLALEGMLVLMLVLMHRNSRSVLRMARHMTDELSEQAVALSESNDDLKKFAHVVSHDLKNPIRNIQDVTEFLEEDLESYLASNDAHPEVSRHLSDLRNQALRGQTLIDGILDYSQIGAADSPLAEVATATLVRQIGDNLRLRPSQLTLSGEFPTLETDAVRLAQVFDNLIGNAFKYNRDTATAHVEVRVDRIDTVYRFAIIDNGPGIDPRFHERIFEPFKTIEATTDVRSSGIGLSIVKRAVERQGGRIELLSEPGAGATFAFTWPERQPLAAGHRAA